MSRCRAVAQARLGPENSQSRGQGDEIQVYWQPDEPGNSTGFKLSPDKKQLIQPSQTEGDKGPKRVFKRC
jgi:hypothetical protein